MIIVEVGRGLGNSMYVYASGLALAEDHKTEFKIDTSFLDAWPRPNYKFGGSWDVVLDKFNISAVHASKKEILRHLFRTWIRPIDRFLYKFKLFERNVIRFPSNGSIEDFYKIPDDTYLIGYFGQDKFFRKIKKKIQKEFTLKDEFKKNISGLVDEVKVCESVSIHVRRGDVLKLKNCYVLDIDYYKKAIGEIKKKVKDPKFYVFSDEIDWCKENLGGLGIELNFIEGHRDYEDMELMGSCKHNVLANSSFSWWAGYLNNNSKKIVVAPKKFTMFQDGEIPELPKDWTLIE
jgi:hypothetical protein